MARPLRPKTGSHSNHQIQCHRQNRLQRSRIHQSGWARWFRSMVHQTSRTLLPIRRWTKSCLPPPPIPSIKNSDTNIPQDIISFDPRGVGFTTPQISCWNSTTTSSQNPSSYLWDFSEPPVLDAHPGIVYDSYAHAAAFSQQCSSLISETGRFVSTPSVARDMLHITEKLGLQKLKYWGFSYGTFLGTTFASMFPDKVERMVNDGKIQ